MRIRNLLLMLPILAGLFLSACGTVKINRLLADPYRYRTHLVRVQGTVVKSFGALLAGFYEVQDDTGTIYVISTGSGVPRIGSRVSVTGTVVNGVTVGGRSFGTAIRERDHHVRY